MEAHNKNLFCKLKVALLICINHSYFNNNQPIFKFKLSFKAFRIFLQIRRLVKQKWKNSLGVLQNVKQNYSNVITFII